MYVCMYVCMYDVYVYICVYVCKIDKLIIFLINGDLHPSPFDVSKSTSLLSFLYSTSVMWLSLDNHMIYLVSMK